MIYRIVNIYLTNFLKRTQQHFTAQIYLLLLLNLFNTQQIVELE